MTSVVWMFAAIGFVSVFVTVVLLVVTAVFSVVEWWEDRQSPRLSEADAWLNSYGRRRPL